MQIQSSVRYWIADRETFRWLSVFLPSDTDHQHQTKNPAACGKHPERFGCVLAPRRPERLSVTGSVCQRWGLWGFFWCALPKDLIQHFPKLTWLSCCEIPWYHLMTLFKQGFLSLSIISQNDMVRERMCAAVVEDPLWHSFLVLINCITN